MSDDLITALSIARQFVPNGTEAAERVDTAMRTALEAQIAAVAPAVDAQPVGVAGAMPGTDGFTMAAFKASEVPVGTPLYTAAQSEGLRKDAERYRWLRDTLHGAKAGGGIEVNHALQVYQQPAQGEEVRIYWYVHTPVGFHDITAATIDDVIDEGMADKDPQ